MEAALVHLGGGEQGRDTLVEALLLEGGTVVVVVGVSVVVVVVVVVVVDWFQFPRTIVLLNTSLKTSWYLKKNLFKISLR